MSDTDSFIDEVTEEVKRDRLFAAMKKYGWIAVLIVLALVGGTAWREYRVTQEARAAQDFGDAVLSAAEAEGAAQAEALAAIDAPNPQSDAMLEMLAAQALADSGDVDGAVARLRAVSTNAAVPQIYRQVAAFKALLTGTPSLPADERRAGFAELAVAGQPLRLLAEEQLALIEVETGEKDAALTRLSAILDDAEVTAGLRQRAGQLIVALGGTLPEQG